MNLEPALQEFEKDLEKIFEEECKFPLGLSEHEFKVAFIPQFLATMAANRFNEYCAMGKQEQIAALPFEDAEFLAEQVYANYKAFKN